MERGRRYARGGRVQDLTVKAGRLEARVQGSRATPYRVSVRSAAPSKVQWRALETAMAARLGWTAQLLAGEVPRDLEEPFAAVGVPLFPRRSTCLPSASMTIPGSCWPGMARSAMPCSPSCGGARRSRATTACLPGGRWACGPVLIGACHRRIPCRPIRLSVHSNGLAPWSYPALRRWPWSANWRRSIGRWWPVMREMGRTDARRLDVADR